MSISNEKNAAPSFDPNCNLRANVPTPCEVPQETISTILRETYEILLEARDLSLTLKSQLFGSEPQDPEKSFDVNCAADVMCEIRRNVHIIRCVLRNTVSRM